ncbi:transcription termination factor 2 [Monomorium pharaonis]|uniref:transcription termination factor 2 n=1 Tax=Monomorium pharaonis TaxID=307658 RepID=UPI00063F0787|nr:transcription termination factor 2 [Monomorium pharaonis]
MEKSFTEWRDSGYRVEGNSIVISDSDEDVVNGSTKEIINRIIDESHDSDFDVPSNFTPRKNIYSEFSDDDDDTPIVHPNKTKSKTKKYNIIDSDGSDDTNYEDDEEYLSVNNINDSESDSSSSYSRIKNKGKKRKDITHDNTREDIKELRPNSSSESSITDNSDHNNIDHEIANVKDKEFPDVAVTIELDSESTSGQNSDSELANSFAKQEMLVQTRNNPGNILETQKRALAVLKLEQLKHETAKMKLLLSEGNVEMLPDKGQKLQECIRQKEEEMKMLTWELENTSLIPFLNDQKTESDKLHLMSDEISKESSESSSDYSQSDYLGYSPLDFNIPMRSPITSPELRELGKKAQATRDKELALTVDRLQDLHGSLIARPSEHEKVEDPRGLKIHLMPHQKHALAWLLWREKQKPSGGVLADDMGLGKTLTMIALIMITLTDPDDDSDNEKDQLSDDDEWTNKDKPTRYKGGTLVVCPASLLSQWENEVHSKCKRGLLSVQVYHGSNRQTLPKKLGKNDMVITTYNILSREYKTNSTLYKIKWKRVVLDEAHVVRNHKSQASEAVCGLVASKRWALTGTPIQNKELDLYSILKFLQCSPFDDLRVWKRWVDNKSHAGHQRLATVMKTLMLRRTKQELMAKGELEILPDKSIEEVIVKLDHQEQLVYEKILIYSRTLFAQFLAQRAEKGHMYDLYNGKYDKPAYLSNPNKATQFTKAQNKLLAMHADVKTHEILVLLLRLRQVCCHPALIHAMLDQEDVKQSGIMDMENVNTDILSRMNNISLNEIDPENPEEKDIGIDERVVENLLTADNPVFADDRISSKMKILLDTVKEILQKGNDKLIIVSQWAMLLEIIASHLSSIKDATYSKFTGSVPIKDRQVIIESFNNLNSGPRILLLSLTAGGVGLNLVGANHLLLFDIHWNPQLETQAQDRIYRFGQKKNVYIYKFVCVNTIEERIKGLQERKLEIARNVLSGDRSAATKLTLNDLKSLFGF